MEKANKSITLDESNFDSVINSGPTLVDFWAEWCGPCRVQGPIIDELASEYGDKVNIGKVDTDKNAGLAEKYEITSIPSIILYKDGEVVDKLIGVQPKEKLLGLINSL